MSQGNLPEIFLDTDVAFDIISKREPHFESSVMLLQMAAKDNARLFISESSLANLFYLAFDIYKIKDAKSKLIDFITVCEVIQGGKEIALSALQSAFKDKEDALQFYTALHAKVDYFITRNIRDYKNKNPALPVYSPDVFFKQVVK